jgi:hypothetical protein
VGNGSGGTADGGAIDEGVELDGEGLVVGAGGEGVAGGAGGSLSSAAVAAGRLEVGIGDVDRSAIGATAQPAAMTSRAVAVAPTALTCRQRFVGGRKPTGLPAFGRDARSLRRRSVIG